MNETERFLYVGFMCHQAIEKILKAYYVKIKMDNPPYSHNLSFLSKESGLYQTMAEDYMDFIDFLEPLNIKCRYPSIKDSILSTLNSEKCLELLQKAEDLQQWIKTKL